MRRVSRRRENHGETTRHFLSTGSRKLCASVEHNVPTHLHNMYDKQRFYTSSVSRHQLAVTGRSGRRRGQKNFCKNKRTTSTIALSTRNSSSSNIRRSFSRLELYDGRAKFSTRIRAYEPHASGGRLYDVYYNITRVYASLHCSRSAGLGRTWHFLFSRSDII